MTEEVAGHYREQDGDASHRRGARLQGVVSRPVDADLLADPPADEPTEQYRGSKARHEDRNGTRGQKGDHLPAPSRAMRSSSSPMTARSLNSIVLPASSCTVSWPFPATTTTSPESADSRAVAMAWRRSGSMTSRAPPSQPARTCSMITRGSSLRGLSEGSTARPAS